MPIGRTIPERAASRAICEKRPTGARDLPNEMRSCTSALRAVAVEQLGPTSPDAAERWFRNLARHALRRTSRRVQARLRAAQRADDAARHRARVALKKFRYLAEVIADATGDVPPVHLARLQAVQSAMGDRRDFELLLQRIEHYARRHKSVALWLESRRAPLRRRQRSLDRNQAEPQRLVREVLCTATGKPDRRISRVRR